MEIIREFLSTVFVVKDNKVLMTWNKKVNNWVPIGGHIEPNELPCSSVIREAKEETGLDIELVSPYDKSTTGNLIQPVHIHLYQHNIQPVTRLNYSFLYNIQLPVLTHQQLPFPSLIYYISDV